MEQNNELAAIHSQESSRRSVGILVVCGMLLWLICSVVARLSGRFSFGTSGVERPIIEVLCLLTAAFAIYLFALRVAIRVEARRELVPIIGIFAISMRLLLLFAEPIQEVDIYRYLWDGQATIHGVSPFQYSPQQVLNSSKDQTLPPDLSRLVAVKDSSPVRQTILKRVHFPELSTVYPPVSQGVFALAALTTPSDAELSTHLAVMKAWIVAFDMITIWLLIRILRLTSKPVGWSLAYAWCPLVLKEFANSGHLDSIAVCLTTLAVYLMLQAFYRKTNAKRFIQHSKNVSMTWAILASIALGLAVGAKLYPIVLSLLLILMSVRRLNWPRATLVAIVFLFVTAGVCWPMVTPGVRDPELLDSVNLHTSISKTSMPPIPLGAVPIDKIRGEQHDPGEGLTTFLSRWKMNDFLFLLVIENLTPMTEIPSEQRPWFVVTSENWRQALGKRFTDLLPVKQEQVPFVLARTVTAVLFLVLAGCFCWRAVRIDEASRFLEAVFLTLAWFWLLLPTQNPWYWIWALPFLPYAHNRPWFALSGLTLLYYLRFWLGYHWPNSPLPFTNYSGELFFDYVVTWIEFGPWFVWLAISSALSKNKATVVACDHIRAIACSPVCELTDKINREEAL